MPDRPRPLDYILLLMAALGPALHLVGFTARRMNLFDATALPLVFAVLILAMSAAVAAFLAFSHRPQTVRLLAVAALLINLGSVLYAGLTWMRDMRRATADALLTPIASGQVGIALCPADHSPISLNELRILESDLNAIVTANGLAADIIVRRAYPVASEEQAQRLGERLKASIIVWKSLDEQDRLAQGYHVTVLGANEARLDLEMVNLMLLMATQNTIHLHRAGPADAGENPAFLSRTVAPVAAACGALATGQPLLALGLLRVVLNANDVTSDTARLLHNYSGLALFIAQRPDLAKEEFALARSLAPDALAWNGTGIVYLARREWPDALRAFNQALALDPYSPLPYCAFGIAAARDRNVARAVALYQQAIALRPRWAAPYALIGLAYELEANIPAAREAYQNCALHAGPNLTLYDLALRRAEEIQRHPPTAVPTATPLPTPTKAPVPTVAIYIVQRGDTLGAIAKKFGVSVQAIVQANEMTDRDTLMIGQSLLIPKQP